MIERLRRWLKNWLMGKDPIPVKLDRYIECVLVENGKGVRKQLFVVGIMGLMLRGVPVGETGERLVSISQAVDPDKFGRLWSAMAGTVAVSWEEEPYDKKT